MPSSFSQRTWRDFDWLAITMMLMLSLWGVATVFSATQAADTLRAPVAATSPVASARLSTQPALNTRSDAVKQIIWVALGLAAVVLLARADFQMFIHLQMAIYLAALVMLMLLMVMPAQIAPTINGAKSWIQLGPISLQPSELAKFAAILALAAFLCRRQQRIREGKTIALSLLYLAPILLLILKQPDFGTMLSLVAMWFGMLFFGGARLRHLALTALCGVLLFGAAWQVGVLKRHQVERLTVFLNPRPSREVMKKEGYQIQQSQIAIGGGGLGGQGYARGLQTRGRQVPENTTDFIFSVVAEEWGFIGSGVLLLLYLGLLARVASVANHTENYFGVLIAGGFASLLAFHAVINLGMTMRVMPMTGVPLPFFSYGGSSFLAFSMGFGVVQSIVSRRRKAVL